MAGAAAHVVVSAVWTVAFAAVARRRPMSPATGAALGAAGGALVAALDLGLIARRWFPAVTTLRTAPQVADHLVFGAVLGALLTSDGAG